MNSPSFFYSYTSAAASVKTSAGDTSNLYPVLCFLQHPRDETGLRTVAFPRNLYPASALFSVNAEKFRCGQTVRCSSLTYLSYFGLQQPSTRAGLILCKVYVKRRGRLDILPIFNNDSYTDLTSCKYCICVRYGTRKQTSAFRNTRKTSDKCGEFR